MEVPLESVYVAKLIYLLKILRQILPQFLLSFTTIFLRKMKPASIPFHICSQHLLYFHNISLKHLAVLIPNLMR